MFNCPKSTYADGEEKIDYDQAGFPFYLRRSLISLLTGRRAQPHFHEDLEYILVMDGVLNYEVNGEKSQMKKGEGIFVNSKALHFGYGEKDLECDYICLLFSPMLLSSSSKVEEKMLTPYLERGKSYLLLPCGSKALQTILMMEKEKNEGTQNPLVYQSLVFALWSQTVPLFPPLKDKEESRQLVIAKEMMKHVKENYAEDLSLESIAKVGHVSTSQASKLFRHYFYQSPVSYLISYRLSQAASMLKDTDKTVEEIAFETGYSSPSFFIRSFKKKYGATPKAYQQKAR